MGVPTNGEKRAGGVLKFCMIKKYDITLQYFRTEIKIMAEQKGPFKFEGKLGNLLGYLDDGEYHVKTIGRVDEEKRRYAPQYEVTRQNEAEFGVATRCGQLFRQSMKHITQRWTKRDYPPKVMQVMLQTLRADTTHIKGQKTMHCGLKNASSQKAFRHLEIYTKKSYEHYRSCLMHETEDPLVWKMNHQDLWSKRGDGDTKSVKLGFLHIDFDQKIANYEDALTIECKRKDNIDYSEHRIAPSGETKLPWTFVIMQVWRDGDKYEPTGMLFMSVLQVIDTNSVAEDGLNGEDEHGAQGKADKERRIVDQNGVNWDVFLDGYLGDGFVTWEIGEEDGQERYREAAAAVEKEEVQGMQRVTKRRLHRLRGLHRVLGLKLLAERKSLNADAIQPDSLPSETTNKMGGTEEERLHGLHKAAFEKEQPETIKAVFTKKPMADKHGFDRISRKNEQENQKDRHLKEGSDNKYDEDLDGLLGFSVGKKQCAGEKENRNIGKSKQYKLSEGDQNNIKIGKNHIRKRRWGVRDKVPLEVVV